MAQEELKQEYTNNNRTAPARGPDFVGDGVAVWLNRDVNGKEYASVKLFGSVRVACFRPEPAKP